MPTTFRVSEKASKDRGRKVLQSAEIGESLKAFLGFPVEASGANEASVVRPDRMKLNGLLGAAHLSFAGHFPLVLSPDSIWLAVAQGFALHVEANSESLRKHFVQHEGQVTILHENRYTKGSPSNPWPESFQFFSDEIEKHIGKKRDLLVSNFSTTGPIERAASEVVLMGAMKDYFKYREHTKCGIPEITLLGTVEDWKDLRTRAANLAEFDLSWWTKDLTEVLTHFVDAAQGKVDQAFWDSLYKEQSRSGGTAVQGWINVFYPYLDGVKQDASASYANRSAWGTTTDRFPSGLTKVPFVWNYLGTEYDMEFLGGFVGVHHGEDLGVRPAIGWAVRDVPGSKPRSPSEDVYDLPATD